MYRIGFLIPSETFGDGLPLRDMEQASAALGFTSAVLAPSELREDSPLDVLISFSAALRKTTSHPTFLADHQPRAAYFEGDDTFDNIASYDGYLCISDNLGRFFAGVAASLDKPLTRTGFFYALPAPSDLQSDIAGLAGRDALRLCIFEDSGGTQVQRLLRRLQARPYVNRPSVGKAQVPPDRAARMLAYQSGGVGLVAPQQNQLLDDTVPMALFEIGWSGACALCPDTPWIRARFDEDVYYYRPFGSPEEILADIDQAIARIKADPTGAQAKAQAVKARLREGFDPKVMLTGVVAYHEQWKAAVQTRAERLGDPIIDVIMRVGGRPPSVIARAVASLDQQTAGRFRLILAAFAPIDLAPIISGAYRRIVEIQVIEAPGGNRARTLVAGLDAVRSAYFCILDDDDYFLAGHVAGLLEAMSRSQDAFRFAYSDVLRLDETAEPSAELSLLHAGPAHGDIFALLARLPSHSFLATSGVLERVRYGHWDLSTAEDGLLISALLRWATPLHSANASAVYCQGRTDASAFLGDSRRSEDVLGLFTEIAAWRADIEARFPPKVSSSPALIGPFARRVIEDRRLQGGRTSASAVLSGWTALDRADLENRASPLWGEDLYAGAFVDEPMVFLPVALDNGRAAGASITTVSEGGAAALRVLAFQPWEVALRVDLADYAVASCSTTAVIAFEGGDEAVSIGLMNEAGEAVAQRQPPSGGALLAAAVGGPDALALCTLFLQAGPSPSSLALTVRDLRLGYRLSELRDALADGDPDISREDLLSRLQARVMNQVLNAPAAPPGHLTPISFRTPACVFRNVLQDGPYAKGAMRTIASGRKPWDYFAQIHVPASSRRGERWLRVAIQDTAEPFYAFLVDEGFETTLSPAVRVAAGKDRVEIWLQAPEDGKPAYIVFQAGDAPGNLPMVLERVEEAA